MNNPIIICPHCSKPARWVENKEIYGKNYGKSYMCYYCKQCEYAVGCIDNTRQPKGEMISREHRRLRRAVHAKIDPLWQSGKITRGHLYARLTRALGFQYHTGNADEETCRKVLALDIENL